jgi:hypothetical protein
MCFKHIIPMFKYYELMKRINSHDNIIKLWFKKFVMMILFSFRLDNFVLCLEDTIGCHMK